MMENQRNPFRPNNKVARCRLGSDARFLAEERRIGNGFRVALRLPGMTEGGKMYVMTERGSHAGVNESRPGLNIDVMPGTDPASRPR